MMGYVQTMGFLPDVDPTTPGVVTDCDGYIPSHMGLKAAYSAVDYNYDALAASCKGFSVARKTDGTTRIIAGTAAKLYEVSGSSWTDRTRASGGDYSTSTARWRFAQFGNTTYAVNQYDTPQYSSSGAFSNHPEMPKARVICAANQFILVGATNEATYGEQTDRWWCSAIGDTDDWTLSVATQCVTGRLIDVPGGLTAIKPLDENVAFFKQRGIYVASYQGPPVVWSFRLVAADIGTWCQESAVNVGDLVYFMGYENFYVIGNGMTPQPIGQGIRDWFFNTSLSRDYADRTYSFYDRYNDVVYWFYPSNSASTIGTIDRWVAYMPATKRWGAGTMTVEAAGEWLTPSPTYDSFGVGLTWDTLPDVVYDSNYWGTTSPAPAVFNSSHKLCTLNGVAGSGSLTTGWTGDDQRVSMMRRVIPRWRSQPTSATMAHTHSWESGGTSTTETAVSMSDGRFDVRKAARWHRDRLQTVGNCDLGGFSYDAVPSGEE